MTAASLTFIGIALVSLGFGVGCLWGARRKSGDPQEAECNS